MNKIKIKRIEREDFSLKTYIKIYITQLKVIKTNKGRSQDYYIML